MKIPEELKYTDNHLWIKKENNVLEIGIAEPATEKAGSFVFLELPEKGSKIEIGDSVAEYEAMKQVGDLPSPVEGNVVDVNQELEDEPGKIAEKPYESWLLKIRAEKETEGYMNAEEAKKYYRKQK